MLEGIHRLRKSAHGKKEFRLLKAVKMLEQAAVREAQDRLEQGSRHFCPDDCGHLQESFRLYGQTIKTRRQHHLDRLWQRRCQVAASPLAGHYEKAVDRESAHEKLKARAEQMTQQAAAQQPKESGLASDILFGKTGPRGGRQSQGLLEAMAKSAARTVGSQVGRELIRGVLGSLLGKRR